MLLDSISCPGDLKKLSLQDLEAVCSELRSEIIRITAKNGGHLGSNLGAIELIVAAHYVFDCPNDKFIFDVGHQSYAHKLLTGRRRLMESLRQDGGASGFSNPQESEYDYFISGHASTSISAAIGSAKARDLNNKHFNLVSFLGDGSLSGGMVYEALNNVSGLKNFVVILNDNQMSISESVGAMRQYLSKLLSSRKGLSLRKRTSKLLEKLPTKFSKSIEKFIKSSMSAIKGWTIFEEFGLQYLGPVDGHNLKDLIDVFKNVRDVANYKPVIIHAITQKGRGYSPAENDATKMHGIEKSAKNRYSDVFGETITKLAESDEKIVCVTAAMKSGSGLSEFAQKFPDRFFDVGIAEAHAVTFAAGLAKEGFKPYVAIYSTFLQRAFDQIYHDVFLQNLPVRFIIDKAGFPGHDGKTHSGIYDISMLQNFEDFMIMAPSSRNELINMLEFSRTYNEGPLAIRFPKAEVLGISGFSPFSRKCKIIQEGRDILVISTGNLLDNVFEAINIGNLSKTADLAEFIGETKNKAKSIDGGHELPEKREGGAKTHTNPTVVDARFVYPFDFESFYELAEKHKKIIVLEEGVFGGLSTIMLENLIRNKQYGIIGKIQFITASKRPVSHSSRDIQLNSCALSPIEIAKLLS